MDKIYVLQLGKKNWKNEYSIPQNVELVYAECFSEPEEKTFDLVFWDREPYEEELQALDQAIKTYTLYVTEQVELQEDAKELYEAKCGQRLETQEIQAFLKNETKFYFSKSYGEKYQMKNLDVSRNFHGKIKWRGQDALELQGEFGSDFQQIAYWRNNIPIMAHQTIDFWLEYKKTPGVEIELVITSMERFSLAKVIDRAVYTEKDLEQVIQLTAGNEDVYIFISIQARGNGTLQIIALHDRYSRGDHGYFLPGGERYVTSDREEVFCYFAPMDRKPPLNIYFSGYKNMQGFEGYYMMQKMGAPFLLISESRLEGGSFYIGSEEYEKMIMQMIKEHIEKLGFQEDEVILSGLSMGTFGALYYGSEMNPHAIILGKPLVSIGDVALNEKKLRYGGFGTSLDVLRHTMNGMKENDIQRLNQKFWNRFDAADWKNTKCVVSYMIEDDYDNTAYQELISHIHSAGVSLYGKGIHGRHNDNTREIVNWFIGQFKNMLREDFGRTI